MGEILCCCRDLPQVLHAPGENCYLILSGTAAVYKEADGDKKLLTHLREGQFFGELALIRQAPRSATVTAAGMLRTLSIEGEKSLEMYARSPQLREYMETLQKVYRLAGHGFTTQYTGKFMDMDCITTLHHLDNGMRIMASQVIGQDIFNMSVMGVEEGNTETLRYQNLSAGIERQLVISDECLVGVTAQGPWAELGEVHQMVIGRTLFYPWQAVVFRQKGMLRIEDSVSLYEDNEVLCACMQVNRGALRQAILSGGQTVAALSDATGAGTVCGACRLLLAEMVGRADWTPVIVSEEIPVTSDSRTFRFTPCATELKPAKPGQHIIVQTQMEGNWIQRAYTLTSASSETDYHEITVKREQQGLFSRWMFYNRRENALIRISCPQGDYYLEKDEKRPIVCLVAGIGVTPALAMCRSVIREETGQHLQIHYSASTQDRFAYRDELQAAAENHPKIHLTLRVTREEGRLTQADVEQLVQDAPEALFYLCGPGPYLRSVEEYLTASGVPADSIRIEAFTHAGGPPTRKETAAKCPIDHQEVRSGSMLVPPIKEGDRVSPVDEARVFLYQFYYEVVRYM